MKPSPSSATITFCPSDLPLWVGVQDGTDGPWTQVNPAASGGSSYSITFTNGRGGLATAEANGSHVTVTVVYLTSGELTTYAKFPTCGGMNAVHGTVAGHIDSPVVNILLSSGTGTSVGPATDSFTINDVPGGNQDLGASRTDARGFTDRFIVRRSVPISDGATFDVLDFESTEAFAPETAFATVAGLGGDTASVSSSTAILDGSFVTAVDAAPVPYLGVPADKLASGELQTLGAVADAQTPTGNRFRSAGTYYRTVSDRTLTMGPLLATPNITTASSAPYLRPRTQLASQAEYGHEALIIYRQTDRRVGIITTAAYLGATPGTWDVTSPDLSSAAGFEVSWGLHAGQPFNWTVAASSGYDLEFDSTLPTDGSTVGSAQLSLNNALGVPNAVADDGDARTLFGRLVRRLAHPRRAKF